MEVYAVGEKRLSRGKPALRSRQYSREGEKRRERSVNPKANLPPGRITATAYSAWAGGDLSGSCSINGAKKIKRGRIKTV
jgi:hypothetical protein